MRDQVVCECGGKFPCDAFGLAHLAASGHLPGCVAGEWSRDDVIEALLTRVAVAESEAAFYKEACQQTAHEVEQVLGKALGYPPLYPEASEVDDGTVGVGDHVAESLADEAADRIRKFDALILRDFGPFPCGEGLWTTRTARGFDRFHRDESEARLAAWEAATAEKGVVE